MGIPRPDRGEELAQSSEVSLSAWLPSLVPRFSQAPIPDPRSQLGEELWWVCGSCPAPHGRPCLTQGWAREKPHISQGSRADLALMVWPRRAREPVLVEEPGLHTFPQKPCHCCLLLTDWSEAQKGKKLSAGRSRLRHWESEAGQGAPISFPFPVYSALLSVF